MKLSKFQKETLIGIRMGLQAGWGDVILEYWPNSETIRALEKKRLIRSEIDKEELAVWLTKKGKSVVEEIRQDQETLTATILMAAGACRSDVIRFKGVFPKGAKWTPRDIDKAAKYGLNLRWIAKLLPEKFRKKAGLNIGCCFYDSDIAERIIRGMGGGR